MYAVNIILVASTANWHHTNLILAADSAQCFKYTEDIWQSADDSADLPPLRTVLTVRIVNATIHCGWTSFHPIFLRHRRDLTDRVVGVWSPDQLRIFDKIKRSLFAFIVSAVLFIHSQVIRPSGCTTTVITRIRNQLVYLFVVAISDTTQCERSVFVILTTIQSDRLSKIIAIMATDDDGCFFRFRLPTVISLSATWQHRPSAIGPWRDNTVPCDWRTTTPFIEIHSNGVRTYTRWI